MPKKTAQQIVASGNHYLLQVKKNQKSLWQEIETVQNEQQAVSVYESQERNRGRQEQRKLRVFLVENELKKQQWAGLSVYAVMERVRNGKQEKAYYISDLADQDAYYFYQASRGHWGIENSLHYVKDVVYKEDKNKIKHDGAAMMASIASSVAINISRKEQEASVSYSQIFFRANVKKALDFIRS